MSGDAWTQLVCVKCDAKAEGAARDLGGLGWGLTYNRQQRKEVRCPACLAPKRRASDRERERLLGRRW